MNNQPPKIPLRFLRRFCDPRLLPYVEGDLLELFEERVSNKGYVIAKWLFFWDVVRLCRPGIIKKPKSKSIIMIGQVQEQFKISIRTLRRHSFYSVVIMLSLVVGFSLTNVLFGYLTKASSMDDYNSYKSHTYRLLQEDPINPEMRGAYIMSTTAEYIRDNYADYKSTCRLFLSESDWLKYENDFIKQPKVMGASGNFLDFFQLELKEGHNESAVDKGNVVITREYSERLFNGVEAIGQLITMSCRGEEKTFKISGVLDLESYNTHLNFDVLVYEDEMGMRYGGGANYFLFSADVDPKEFSQKLTDNKDIPSLGDGVFYLQPLDDIHTDVKNKGSYSRTISGQIMLIGWIVSFLILTLSALNFMNLYALTSIYRRKELGIKKILGVSKRIIWSGFGVDVFIYLFVSGTVALLISTQLLSFFNFRFDADLTLTDLFSVEVGLLWLAIFGLFLIITMIYGSTRFRLSAPVQLLTRKSDFRLRINKFLLVPQFLIAAVMVLCTWFMLLQMDYTQAKPLGMDREILVLHSNDTLGMMRMKQDLLNRRLVEKAALAQNNPLGGYTTIQISERDDIPDMILHAISGDLDLIETLGLTISKGSILPNGGVYINRNYENFMNGKDPFWDGTTFSGAKVEGVFEDINTGSFHDDIQPTVLMVKPSRKYTTLLLNYKGKSLEDVLGGVLKSWSDIFPNDTFDYSTINETLRKAHADDYRLMNIVSVFAVSGILIAFFGLFALAWGIIQNRTKEIAIRKVMGASVDQILILLSRDFLRWVVVAFMIAVPIAFWAINSWLQNFAYHIEITSSVFISVGAGLLIVSLLIVCAHSLRITLSNPVESLRDE